MQHIDLGRKILDQLMENMSAIGEVEKPPKMEGRIMSMVFQPNRNKGEGNA